METQNKPTKEFDEVFITYHDNAGGVYSSVKNDYDISRLLRYMNKSLGSEFTHYRQKQLLNNKYYTPRKPTGNR